MPTDRQSRGNKGEVFIAKHMPCLKCKRHKTLKQLPNNFKCADLICDFCSHTSQVKTFQKVTEGLPDTVLGAAWGPQIERMNSGIYHALWFVRVDTKDRVQEVWLLPSELQTQDLFQPRRPLSDTAKRAGWQGYLIDTKTFAPRITQIK